MRAHSKTHPDPSFVEEYVFRDGSEPIGGTLIIEGRHHLRQQFDRFQKHRRFLHITLSLPEGMRANDTLWRQIIVTQLELMKLPPFAIPWAASRHTDTNCDHVHIAVALVTFLGLPVAADLSETTTDRNHRKIARMLGLPVPEYFDPAYPVLRPVTPQRRLKSKVAKALHSGLTRVFEQNAPRTVEELSKSLNALPEPIVMTTSANNQGVESYDFATRHGSIRGGALGRAWEPRYLRARLAHVMALSCVRLIHALLPFHNKLKELTDAARTEITATKIALQGAHEPVERDRREDRSPTAIARTPRMDEERPLGFGEAIPQRSVDTERGTEPAPRPPSPSGSGAETKHRETGRTDRRTRSTREADAGDRQETRQTDEDHAGPDEVIFAAWLARVLFLLRANFDDWRWERVAENMAIRVEYKTGEAVILSTDGLDILIGGPEADRAEILFASERHKRLIGTREPKPIEAQASYLDDDLGF